MTLNKRADIWDKKAKRYPIYDKSENSSAKRLLKTFGEHGVDLHKKRVLDIGCGTGRNTIEIAKIAGAVDALDISEEMLLLLEKSAKEEGISNIKTVRSSFIEADIASKYDVVVATMTPALQTKEDFEKAICAATQSFAYVGWGRYRSSPFLEEAFRLCGATLHLPFGAPAAAYILCELGYDANPVYSNETWEKESDIQEAVEDICWHIEIGGTKPNREVVERFVRGEFKDRVKYSHELETGLIVCKL